MIAAVDLEVNVNLLRARSDARDALRWAGSLTAPELARLAGVGLADVHPLLLALAAVVHESDLRWSLDRAQRAAESPITAAWRGQGEPR